MTDKLPGARAALVDNAGVTTPSFYRYFQALERLQAGTASAADVAAVNAQIAVINAEIAALPKSSYPKLQVSDPITSSGLLQNGFAKLGLATLADSGAGTFKLITRDTFGRLSGTKVGTSADVPFTQAGTNAVPRNVHDKLLEIISVKDFGAVGDGVTDDTAAFLNAVSALSGSSNQRGGVIHVPAGNYIIKSSIVIYPFGLLNNIKIHGSGRETTYLDFSSAPAGTHGICITTGTNFEISDLTVNGAPGSGIYIGTGNTVGGASNCHDFCLRNVRSQSNGARGIYIVNAYLGRLVDCWVQHNASNGIQLAGYHTTMLIERCESSSNGGWGFALNGCTYSSLQACGADGNTGGGYALNNARAVSFIACGAESNGHDGWTILTSNSSATGIPAAAQDIHGVALINCFGLNNSALSAGTYATFLGASAADGRPIELKIIGGSAAPSTTSDRALIASSTSGTVTIVNDGLYYDGFSASDSKTANATIRYRGAAGLKVIAALSANQPLTSLATTSAALSTLLVNTLGATISGNAIVIPANVSAVRVSASAGFDANASGVRQLFVLKNGASVQGLPSVNIAAPGSGAAIIGAASPPIAVSPGDQISMQVLQNSGSTINLDANAYTWLAVEAVE